MKARVNPTTERAWMSSRGAAMHAKAGWIAVVLLALLACSSSEQPAAPTAEAESVPNPPGRVLLIGVDGASVRLLDRLKSEGRLPNLSKLVQKGASGVFRPEPPLLSPRIWTSVATGKRPANHGIEGWARIAEDGTPYLYSGNERHARALWNIVSAAGMRVGVVNWLMTHPPEVVNGVIVSDHAVEGMEDDKLEMASQFARNMKGAQGEAQLSEAAGTAWVSPASFEGRVRDARTAPPLTGIPSPFADLEKWPPGDISDFMRRVYDADEFAAQVALAIDREYRPELLLVYLPGVDRISHFLWDSIEPPEVIPEHMRWPDFIVEKHSTALITYYEYVDELIGRLTEGRGPNDLVVVISDHSFETDVSGSHPKGVHESPAARDGILVVRGPGVPTGRRNLVFRMLDIAPTLLAWLGVPPATDMDGSPAPWMKLEVPAAVASYDHIPVERVGHSSPEVDSRIIENLKELGYVE